MIVERWPATSRVVHKFMNKVIHRQLFCSFYGRVVVDNSGATVHKFMNRKILAFDEAILLKALDPVGKLRNQERIFAICYDDAGGGRYEISRQVPARLRVRGIFQRG